MHSEICPVCQGKGLIPAVDVGDPMDDYNRKPCHGCKGRGWIEVQDSGFPFIPCDPPAPVYPWPLQPYPYTPDPWTPPNIWENDNQVTQKNFPQWTFTVKI